MLGKSYWDSVSGVYDIFERVYNKRCYDGTGERVAEEIDEGDNVLECACGTGSISVFLAKKCRRLVATDLSSGMMRQAEKKCRAFGNTRFCKADITELRCRDEVFDKVVAGNVIHLLDEPKKAIDELLRVCKRGGKVIIPTYINMGRDGSEWLIKLIDIAGANFARQFDMESYKKFFADCGYENVRFDVVEGRMPCALAVITKQ